MLPSKLVQIAKRSTVIPAKIFVGNINFETTKEQLVELLSAVGPVKDAYLPTDRATGRPRGFAFVEFASDQEAAEAIEKFNNHELGGRRLRVNAAEERRPRAPRAPSSPRFNDNDFSGGGGGGGGGGAARGEWDRPAKPKGSRRGLRGKKRSL